MEDKIFLEIVELPSIHPSTWYKRCRKWSKNDNKENKNVRKVRRRGLDVWEVEVNLAIRYMEEKCREYTTEAKKIQAGIDTLKAIYK